MTPEEARQRVGRLDKILWDRTGYDEDSPREQQRTRAAVAVLLEHGTEGEQRDAAEFFARRAMSAAEAALATRLYVDRGWDSTHPLAVALGRTRDVFEEDRARLLQVFLSAPERHLEVAKALIRTEPHGPAWDALAALAQRTEDAKLLRRALTAASEVGRQDDFLALLRGRPVPLLRALAAELNVPWAEPVLRRAGLLGDG
jgi:hypothetical protein